MMNDIFYVGQLDIFLTLGLSTCVLLRMVFVIDRKEQANNYTGFTKKEEYKIVASHYGICFLILIIAISTVDILF